MTILEAASRVVEGLESLSIPYMLVGSLSSSAYGIPRATQDADFCVELSSQDLDRLMKFLGPQFKLDPQMTFETVTGTTRYKLLLPRSVYSIELFIRSEDAHDRLRFSQRVQKPALGRTVWLPIPEDVIIMKLRWAKGGERRKDVDDVFGVMCVQNEALNWQYIEKWCDQHATRALLEETRSRLPQ